VLHMPARACLPSCLQLAFLYSLLCSLVCPMYLEARCGFLYGASVEGVCHHPIFSTLFFLATLPSPRLPHASYSLTRACERQPRH
jgi:hypothetical protein